MKESKWFIEVVSLLDCRRDCEDFRDGVIATLRFTLASIYWRSRLTDLEHAVSFYRVSVQSDQPRIRSDPRRSRHDSVDEFRFSGVLLSSNETPGSDKIRIMSGVPGIGRGTQGYS